MIFDSFSFIFICFIPSVLAVLVIDKVGRKYRIRLENLILLLFSLLFFAWSGTVYLKSLIFLIVFNYVIGMLKDKSKVMLILGIIGDVGILIYYKYLYLIVSTLNGFLHKEYELWDILVPLGISFIVFECISYLMDLYLDKTERCTNFLNFALFLAFFPKLIEGPIVQYHDMEEQLKRRTIEFDKVVGGIERCIIGLSKKVLLGDILSHTYTGIFQMGTEVDAGTAWIAVLSYALGLYMDFSGYSDMAIGMASIFGFSFKENFNFPYLSTSVSEFWRRWHISLGTWFREYVYIPLGGSRKGNVYLHLLIVFLITGIWHGAAWVYLFWGMLHGICVVAERYFMKKAWYQKIPVFIKWLITFLIVSVGWITFNVATLDEFWKFIGCLVGRGHASSFTAVYYLTPRVLFIWGVVIVGMIIFSRSKVQIALSRWNEQSVVFNGIKYAILLLCLYLCFITTVSEGYTPFLYFQF